MSRYDAVVIGAGVNGLVAAAVLAKGGKSVCIVEQRSDIGGMATYSLDDGPSLAHSLYNLSPRVVEDLGLDVTRLPSQSEQLPTVSLCESGRHVVWRDSNAEYSDGAHHPDANAAKELFNRLVIYGGLLRQLGELPPPGGMDAFSISAVNRLLRFGRFGLKLRGLGKPEMRRFLQVLLSNAYDLILNEMSDGPLAGMFAADAVRGAAVGPRSPGTVFNLIYRMGHGGVITCPDGGVGAAVSAFGDAAKKAGCIFKTGITVKRVLIQNDCVAGVETSDGSVLSAELVLAGCSPQKLIELTGPDHEDIEISRRIRNIRARGTTAKVNLRLDASLPIPGLPPNLARARLLVAPSVAYVETAFNPAKYRQLSDQPVLEVVPMQHNGAHWLSMIVQYAPSDLAQGWSDSVRQMLLNSAIETLAQFAPDITRRIEDSQVISPDQIEVATGAPGGHWHHAEMSLDQVLTLRPANGLHRYRMGPKGLFLCGASSHPGGDIMGLAGRNAALTALEAGL